MPTFMQNHPRRCKALVASLLLLLPWSAAAQTDSPATSPASPDIQPLITDLGNESFEKREAAQQSLLQLPVNNVDALRAAEKITTDAEIKSRLHEIINAMEIQIATSAPGISIDLTDAPLKDVAAALGQQTGIFFELTQTTDDTYSLHAKDRPFWEIIRQLSEQHPIGVGQNAGNWRITPLPAPRQRNVTRGVAFSGDASIAGAQLDLTAVVGLDPRLQLISAQPPTIESAIDDLQNALALDDAPRILRAIDPAADTHVWSETLILPAPQNPAKTITARGHVTIRLPLTQEKQEFADLERQVDHPIAAGDCAIKLRQVLISQPITGFRTLGLKIETVAKGSSAAAPQRAEMSLTGGVIHIKPASPIDSNGRAWFRARDLLLTQDDEMISAGVDQSGSGNPPAADHGPPNAAQGEQDDPATWKPWIDVLVVDATGRQVMLLKIPEDTTTTTIAATQVPFAEPLKLIIRRTTKSVEATLPFELKDVPVK